MTNCPNVRECKNVVLSGTTAVFKKSLLQLQSKEKLVILFQEFLY